MVQLQLSLLRNPIRALVVVMGTLIIGAAPSTMLGQALATASLTGKAVDAQGNAIPGAKVTVTGAALQVPQVNSVTDAEGSYTILDLAAPGAYRVVFSAVGFQTYVQADVHLTVGLTGRVDANMKVGAVSEVVEVSGSNPVLDPVSVTNTATLQMSLNIAAGLGLGGNESYPDLFQPFGGFPDGVGVQGGYVTMAELPGIGFEGKSDLIRVMRNLAEYP